VRSALVAALVAGAQNSLRSRVRRFLRGLSCDELQFIASFLGACILESAGKPHGIVCISGGVPEFERRRGGPGAEDSDLKMILLLEYLCRGGIERNSIAVPSEARPG
jgi:hypothetical protein